MNIHRLTNDSLVLYKSRSARVVHVEAKKVSIELNEGQILKVRFKDVILLHPGPLKKALDLRSDDGELLTAWELLAGETTDISELAELIYGEYTPSTAWASWQLVKDGLYFKGDPWSISVCTSEEVEKEAEYRDRKSAEEKAWNAFIDRANQGTTIESDLVYLQDVTDLALGKRDGSRVLKALKLAETPEQAHDFLLRTGYWDYQLNPYPARFQLPMASPRITMDLPPDEDRRDLTHLTSYAIDDEGSSDPDDALSIENGRLWVHIADAASTILPNSPADMEARARGANLYLPERTVTMLPHQATTSLALGLSDLSPALSFGLDLSESGDILAVEIVPSWVRVTRLTYDEVESRLSEPLFSKLNECAQISRRRRNENGAIEISLPEVTVRVVEGKVQIRPLLPHQSRELVREAMLMAGEAVARYAITNEIPMPFATQERPASLPEFGNSISQMFSIRNSLRPSRQSSHPGPHSGLGMEMYVQATSPLRRYLDLVAHQQLRTHLSGSELLSPEEVIERIGSVEAVKGSVRRAERYSDRHWTLVYLMQNPKWRGQGIVVRKRGAKATCLIPELALEIGIYLGKDLKLDSEIMLAINSIDLANQEADFRVVE